MKSAALIGIAALALAACSIVDPNYAAAEGRALAPASVRPGTGYIRSVAVAPGARESSSSAGGSADRNIYRLYVDMDTGNTQTVDVDTGRFMPGQRVEISPDGRVAAF